MKIFFSSTPKENEPYIIKPITNSYDPFTLKSAIDDNLTEVTIFHKLISLIVNVN